MIIDEQIAVLEGLLFVVGDEGINIEQISYVLDLNKEMSMEVIGKLRDKYQKADSGLEIVELANVFKLATKKEHKHYYARLIENNAKQGLSQAALETLAIIAYNQPITRIEIEDIRGVSSDSMIRKLLAKNLIEEAGRSDAIGKPIFYAVTKEFMDCFNLKSLDELPTLELNDSSSEELFDSKYQEK